MSGPIVVVGSGAREHALAITLARSRPVIVTPGSAAMVSGSISISTAPPAELGASLVVIGPEAPLVEGLADSLRAEGIAVFGPGRAGALLEGSKAFMKEVLVAAGVPTAAHCSTGDAAEAVAMLRSLAPPYVVKTDGLAAGKGVLVTPDLDLAIADVEAKLSGTSFGRAGTTVVVEEGLVGEECSLMVLCDGERLVPLQLAQDFKRLRDGDEGPNTGGMGAYSPMALPAGLEVESLTELCVAPLLAELRRRGIEYRGVLYAGLMLTATGPKVIEFNVRFGDPEAEVLLARWEGDVAAVLAEVARGELRTSPSFSTGAAVCVVLAAEGYPEAPVRGAEISGLGPDGQLAEPIEGVVVFHAGTMRVEPDGPFLVNGGRVLTVTASAPDLPTARQRAYAAVDQLRFAGCQFRHDIAASAAGASS